MEAVKKITKGSIVKVLFNTYFNGFRKLAIAKGRMQDSDDKSILVMFGEAGGIIIPIEDIKSISYAVRR